MNQKELKNRIQQSFLDLAPDIYDQIKDAPLPNADEIRQFSEKSGRHGNKRSGLHGQRNLFYCAGTVIACMLLFLIINIDRNNISVIMDVNPSIRFILNGDYEIKQIEGLNEDGKEVVQKMDWSKKCSLSEGLDDIVRILHADNYLGDRGTVLVTVQGDGNCPVKEFQNKFEKELQNSIKKVDVQQVVVAFWYADGKADKSGRELLQQDLIEQYGFTKEECEKMTVEELLASYAEKSGQKLESKKITGKQKEKEEITTTAEHQEKMSTQEQTIQKEETVTTEILSEEMTTQEKQGQSNKGHGNGSSNGNIGNGQIKEKENNGKNTQKEKDTGEKKEKKTKQKKEKPSKEKPSKGKNTKQEK